LCREPKCAASGSRPDMRVPKAAVIHFVVTRLKQTETERILPPKHTETTRCLQPNVKIREWRSHHMSCIPRSASVPDRAVCQAYCSGKRSPYRKYQGKLMSPLTFHVETNCRGYRTVILPLRFARNRNMAARQQIVSGQNRFVSEAVEILKPKYGLVHNNRPGLSAGTGVAR